MIQVKRSYGSSVLSGQNSKQFSNNRDETSSYLRLRGVQSDGVRAPLLLQNQPGLQKDDRRGSLFEIRKTAAGRAESDGSRGVIASDKE